LVYSHGELISAYNVNSTLQLSFKDAVLVSKLVWKQKEIW